MTTPVLKRRFTIEDFQQMGRAGILTEDDRVELIEGEIVQMSPIGSRHAACVGRLTRLFGRAVGDRAIVWVQNPVDLGKNSELQPDLALLRPRQDFYAPRHPTAAEVLLLIEVLATSGDYDRDVKLPLYAQAGITEVWFVDLERDHVGVYRNPVGSTYSNVAVAGSILSPQALLDLSLPVSEMLPPR